MIQSEHYKTYLYTTSVRYISIEHTHFGMYNILMISKGSNILGEKFTYKLHDVFENWDFEGDKWGMWIKNGWKQGYSALESNQTQHTLTLRLLHKF